MKGGRYRCDVMCDGYKCQCWLSDVSSVVGSHLL